MGFSEKLFIFLLIREGLFKKRLEKNKCYFENIRYCLLDLVGSFFVLSVLSNLSIVFFYHPHPRKNLLLLYNKLFYLLFSFNLKNWKNWKIWKTKFSIFRKWVSIGRLFHCLGWVLGMVAFGRLIKKTEFCFAILMAYVIFAC